MLKQSKSPPNSTYNDESVSALPPHLVVALAAIMSAVEHTAREAATAQWSLLQFENASAPSATNDDLLSVEKTAELLDVVPQTVLSWRKSGTLIGYRMGNRVYFKRSEVLAALKVQSTPDGRRKYARRQYEQKAR